MADNHPQQTPLIFQCRECRTIVGDSTSTQSIDERRNCVVLSQTLLGRQYGTPTALAGLYFLSIDALSSYALGGTTGIDRSGDEQRRASSSSSSSSPDAPDRLGALEADLRTEIHKLQGVILSLHERLTALETAPAPPPPATSVEGL